MCIKTIEEILSRRTGKKTVLFSGRFSVPHPGHFATISRLAETFGKVKVVILDYPERKTTIEYACLVFNEMFKNNSFDVEILISPWHFGYITKEQIEKFRPFDIYAAGNMQVLLHIESLGIETFYVPRAYDYKASLMELEKN